MELTLIAPLVALAALSGITLVRFRQSKPTTKRKLPPGPPQDPVIGNLRELLPGDWYDTFTQWSKKYGDVVYGTMFGIPTVVISSHLVAEDLFSKRTTHNGRPQSFMINDLMGWGWNAGFMDPGKEHTQIRTYIRKGTGPQAVLAFRPAILDEGVGMLKTLLNFSGDPAELLHNPIGSALLRGCYGERYFREHGPELLAANREGLAILTEALNTFRLVDFIPILRYLPGWLPGMQWKKMVTDSRPLTDLIRFHAWDYIAAKRREPGGYETCITTELIESEGDSELLRDAMAIVYGAGADTTHTALLNFILVMLVNPDIQRKVQNEIDELIGYDHIPTYEDIESLSYFQAAWKESYRCRPPTILSLPRWSSQGEYYGEYYIPKDALIHPNIGAMLRHPKVWDDPDRYVPERFLVDQRPDQPDPSALVFGFGRRVCPGRVLAEEIGPLFALQLFWAFKVEPVPGIGLPKKLEWDNGAISHPKPFQVQFKPRSERISQLIMGA